MDKLRHARITGLTLQAFYEVYNKLGYGFLERVYENAMAIAARKLGLRIEQQLRICVHYEGILVGKYAADLVADNTVLIEFKAARTLTEEHEAQLLNYLKATPYEVGLLLNFEPKAGFSWLKPKETDTDLHGSSGE